MQEDLQEVVQEEFQVVVWKTFYNTTRKILVYKVVKRCYKLGYEYRTITIKITITNHNLDIALLDIWRYQKLVDLLIPKLPF